MILKEPKRLQIQSAMLMAAGLGTRLRPFTNHQTKALMPLMGVPMAQWVIDSLVHSGVQRIVANVHHHAEQTARQLLGLNRGSAQMILSDESQGLLGSAGGLRTALPSLGSDPFFLANADVLSDLNWQTLSEAHFKLKAQWDVWMTLMVFPEAPWGARYREIHWDSSTGLITHLGAMSERKPFFIGAAVMEPKALESLLPHQPADFVSQVLLPAIEEKRAGVCVSQGSWYDIGEPALWLKAHLALMEKFELGDWKSPVEQLWQKRLISQNRRLSPQVWVSERTELVQAPASFTGPCYWDFEPETTDSTRVRQVMSQGLGPNSVLYGVPSGPQLMNQGIGLGGHWVSLGGAKKWVF
ncbi:MAG: sugar phosphate nucleotidyltransferase [Bdellovibrionia bacterium]